jgi:hypothetical protein
VAARAQAFARRALEPTPVVGAHVHADAEVGGRIVAHLDLGDDHGCIRG